MIMLLIAILYILFESYLFIRHWNIHNKFDKYKLNDFSRNRMLKMDQKFDILIDDIKSDHIDVTEFIHDMHNPNTKLTDLSRDSMFAMLKENIYFPHNVLYDYQITKINETINLCEQKLNHIFSNDIKPYRYYQIASEKFNSWYKPIFLKVLMFGLKTMTEFNMCRFGYHQYDLGDGLVAWIKTGSSECITFFPPSIGGITFYQSFIKQIKTDKTICLFELAGMSWKHYVTDPPDMNTIANHVTTFLIKLQIKKVNMFAHSFGGVVMSHIINNECFDKHSIKLNKTIYIECPLFHIGIHKTLKNITKSWYKIIQDAYDNFIIMFLFHRDIYVQFYLQRQMNLCDSILMGTTNYEKTGKIYSLMAQNDFKFDTQEYVNYITKKQLNIQYFIYPDCAHGAFTYHLGMQQKVLEILND